MEPVVFLPPISPSHRELPQCSDQDFAMDKLQASQSTVQFDEILNRIPQKHISQLENSAIHNRLAELRSHIEAVAQHEDCTPKTIAMFLVILYLLEEDDNSTANVFKEMINTGKFGQLNNKLFLDASPFLLDSLEIGKSNI